MTENKQFKIVNDCGDYHLLDGDEQLGYDLCSYSMRKANWNNVVDKLNEQDERIKKLETELSNMTQRFGYELQMKLKYHSKLIECEKKGDDI